MTVDPLDQIRRDYCNDLEALLECLSMAQGYVAVIQHLHDIGSPLLPEQTQRTQERLERRRAQWLAKLREVSGQITTTPDGAAG